MVAVLALLLSFFPAGERRVSQQSFRRGTKQRIETDLENHFYTFNVDASPTRNMLFISSWY